MYNADGCDSSNIIMTNFPSHLTSLRSSIDEIDNRILTLLVERMACSAQVAQFKKEHKKAIYDPDREKILIEKVTNEAKKLGIDEEFVQSLWNEILTASRKKQAEI